MKRKKDCTSCQHCNKYRGAQYKSFGSSNNKIWWLCDLQDWRIDFPDQYTCGFWKARPYERVKFKYKGE